MVRVHYIIVRINPKSLHKLARVHCILHSNALTGYQYSSRWTVQMNECDAACEKCGDFYLFEPGPVSPRPHYGWCVCAMIGLS